MGQISNILDGRFVPASAAGRPAPHLPQPSQFARLIPGAENNFWKRLVSRRHMRAESADLSALAAALLASFLFPVVLLCVRVNVPRLPLFTALLVSPVLTALMCRVL